MGIFGTYLGYWPEDPYVSFPFNFYNYKFEGQELKIPKSTEYSPLMKENYNLLDLSKKIEEHNKTVVIEDSKFLKKRGLNIDKGCFPDIYTYINGGFGKDCSIDLISPTKFLYKQYYHLHVYTLEYNTLLLCKNYLNNESLDSKKDLAEKSNDYWYLNQIYRGRYPSIISQYLNNESLRHPYIWNPLNPEVYKHEVLENILFVGLRILEHQWTIAYVRDHYDIDYLKNLTLKHEIIAFYNKLHSDLKKEVYSENLKWYKLYKKIWINQLAWAGYTPKFIIDNYITTPLSEDTYHKDPRDLMKELQEEIRDKELKKKLTKKNKLQSKFKIPKIKKSKVKFLHKSKPK